MRIALMLELAIALGACGGESARTIAANGVGIELPAGWQGRIVQSELGAGTYVIAGNFDVPSDEDWLGPKTSRAMSGESIYVWVEVHPLFEHMQEGRWQESTLPIAVGESDLGNLEGFYSPVEAGRWLVVDGNAIIAVVGFGKESPNEVAFSATNRVLGTLTLDG